MDTKGNHTIRKACVCLIFDNHISCKLVLFGWLLGLFTLKRVSIPHSFSPFSSLGSSFILFFLILPTPVVSVCVIHSVGTNIDRKQLNKQTSDDVRSLCFRLCDGLFAQSFPRCKPRQHSKTPVSFEK